MMLAVDSAPPPPPGGLRNGGRSAGSGDSTFQDCLDGVPAPADGPESESDPASRPASSSTTTSAPEGDDDPRATTDKRRVLRPSDDVYLGLMIAPVMSTVDAAGARSITAATAVLPSLEAPTPPVTALAAGVGSTVPAELVAALSSSDVTTGLVPASPADVAPTTAAAAPLTAAPPADVLADVAAAVATPIDTTPAAEPSESPTASAATGDLGALAADAAVDQPAALHPGTSADATPVTSPVAPSATAPPSSPTAPGSAPASAPVPAADASPADTSLADTDPNGAPAARATAAARRVDATTGSVAAEVVGLVRATAPGPGKRPPVTVGPTNGRASAAIGHQLNIAQPASSPAAAADLSAPPAVGGVPMPSATAPAMVTSSEMGHLEVDVDLGGEGLGPLRLRAKAIAGEIHVALSATDPHLRATLGDHVQDLRRDLHSSGLELASFDVNSSPDQNAGTAEGHGDAGQSGHDRSPGSPGTRGPNGQLRRGLVTESIQPVRAHSPAGLDLRL